VLADIPRLFRPDEAVQKGKPAEGSTSERRRMPVSIANRINRERCGSFVTASYSSRHSLSFKERARVRMVFRIPPCCAAE